MEPKKGKSSGSLYACLIHANKQIDALTEKILPASPHLLSVPTKTPYAPVFPHENLNTPFESWEVHQLQYMTLISNADRGVGYAAGNWEDTIYNKSPSSADLLSGTPTPNPARDSRKPAMKMSIADYKNLKTTGVKPSPRPAVTPESRLGNGGADHRSTHSRNTSAVSDGTPMGRVPSFEGPGSSQNGIGASSRLDRLQRSANLREDAPAYYPKLPSMKEDSSRPPLNGASIRDSLHTKDTNKDPRLIQKSNSQQPTKEPLRHSLPPRPQSPPRKPLPEPRQQKRPSDSGDAPHSEKRAKIDHLSEHSSSSSKTAGRKSEADIRSSPAKSQRLPEHTPARSSPQSKKATPTTKPLNTNNRPSKPLSSETPLKLPPLLSPLPADLDPSPPNSSASLKKSENGKAAHAKTPFQNSRGTSDTIVVKQPHNRKDMASSTASAPSRSSQPSQPFILPRLLSPELPDVVEAELLRLQQKSATINSVEARHEKARLPGAPGVAQKRPKLGHPPKKSNAESSSSGKRAASERDERPSLIVKLSYSKRDRKQVERLLRFPSKPSAEFKTRELAAQGHQKHAPSSLARDESGSEEDVPIASSRAVKTPATSISKKRPADPDRSEPAAKRAKVPLETINVAKASTSLAPPFKSPALNGPSVSKGSSHLATPRKSDTPRKGDAMKSVAMRKVDSSEGNVRTPQPTSTSTPSTAEKPKAPPGKVHDPEQLARARAEDPKYLSVGTSLKRQMQSALTKGNLSDADKKTSVMHGIECLMAYMLAFHYRTRAEILTSRPQHHESWEQFIPIWQFVESYGKQFPELRALLHQLNAIVREQLLHIYTSQTVASQSQAQKDLPPSSSQSTSASHPPDDPVSRLISGNKHRESAWSLCRAHEPLLHDLGLSPSSLSPASSIWDAVGFAKITLACYAKLHNLEWDCDPHFSEAPVEQFRRKQGARDVVRDAAGEFKESGKLAKAELKTLSEL